MYVYLTLYVALFRNMKMPCTESFSALKTTNIPTSIFLTWDRIDQWLFFNSRLIYKIKIQWKTFLLLQLKFLFKLSFTKFILESKLFVVLNCSYMLMLKVFNWIFILYIRREFKNNYWSIRSHVENIDVGILVVL